MASKKARESLLWYCRFHDERTAGRTHVIEFTDEDGCCHRFKCHRPREFREIREVLPRKAGARRAR